MKLFYPISFPVSKTKTVRATITWGNFYHLKAVPILTSLNVKIPKSNLLAMEVKYFKEQNYNVFLLITELYKFYLSSNESCAFTLKLSFCLKIDIFRMSHKIHH